MKEKKKFVDPVLKYPNAMLREICSPVEGVGSPEVKGFAQKLLIVCRMFEAFGLSAPQVGIPLRVVVIETKSCPLVKEFGYDPGDCSPNPIQKEYTRERHCYLINPIISNVSKETFKYKEGCLSLPKIQGVVSRPRSFDVTFFGVDGKSYTEHIKDTSTDVYGIIVQHEIDHLDGKLFIDKMDNFNLMKINNRINKLRRK